MKSYHRCLLFLLISISLGFASQEGIVPASELSYSADGIGASGPVEVKMKAGKRGEVARFQIVAFGKVVELNKSELAKIPKFSYNGMNVSYERGYVDAGGKTLYIVLSSRFSESVLRETMIIFSETLPIEIFEKKIKRETDERQQF